MRRAIQIGLVITVWASMNTSVMGQYGLGDGRGLDANPQQGSGGRNTTDEFVNPGAIGNAIVTGNVSGLAAFRGEVGYSAPGDFTERTGSDDLFRFRRQSFPTYESPDYDAQSYGGASGGQGGNVPTGPSLIRGPASGAIAGELTGGFRQLGVPTRLAHDDPGSARIAQATATHRLEQRDYLRSEPTTMGMIENNGERYVIESAPLIGVRQMRADDADRRRLERSWGYTPRPAPDTEEGQSPFDAVEEDPVDQTEAAFLSDRSMEPLSLLVADAMAEPMEGRAQGMEQQQELSRMLERVVFTGLSRSHVEPGEDSYTDLIRRIHDLSTRPGAEPAVAKAPEKETPPKPNGTALTAQLSAALTDPDGGAMPALIVPQPATRKPVMVEAPAPITPKRPRRAIDDLLDQIDHDLPPLSTLASPGGSRFNEIMASAETLMREGEYFTAIDEYARALVLKPRHPMALVGQMHAELGAGLWTSAAFHLRQNLVRYPELIATRYSQPVLPSTTRLQTIEKRLIDLGDESTRADAPVLLAYLAYQQDKPVELQNALSDFERSSETNAKLAMVLRRIWVSR